MKKRARHQIADAAVRRWCRFYDVTPYFWKANPDSNKAGILYRSESERRVRKHGSFVEYGDAEDRADCMAMIVGTLYVKGFERQELSELLEIAGSTVWRFLDHYKSIPNETRRDLISLDGDKAPEFYRSIVNDWKADQITRLQEHRRKVKEQQCKKRNGTSRRPSRTGDSR